MLDWLFHRKGKDKVEKVEDASQTPLKPTPLSYPKYYTLTVNRIKRYDESHQVFDKPITFTLTLSNAVCGDHDVTLSYKWARLGRDDYDELRDRFKAFITCAIYDAAKDTDLICDPGPVHDEKPTWRIKGERMPITLVFCEIDVTNKTLTAKISSDPYIKDLQHSDGLYQSLARGFKTTFESIIV